MLLLIARGLVPDMSPVNNILSSPEPNIAMYCVRHRAEYMRAWNEGMKSGMSAVEARQWAELDISDKIQKGLLARSYPDPLVPDDTGAAEILPPNPIHAPRKLMAERVKPKTHSVIDITGRDSPLAEFVGPLPPIASLEVCILCKCVKPCHLDWCGFTGITESELPEPAGTTSITKTVTPPVIVIPPTEMTKPRFPFVKPKAIYPQGGYSNWYGHGREDYCDY